LYKQSAPLKPMDAQATLKSNERIDRRNFDAAAFAKDNALELVGVNFFMVRISVYIALVLEEAPKGREAHSDLSCRSARTLKDAACLQHRNHISSIAISNSTSLLFFIALRSEALLAHQARRRVKVGFHARASFVAPRQPIV
jgi:hypothetical protein